MAEITIANAAQLPPASEWPHGVVYVGRAIKSRGLAGSPLANPYKIGQKLGTLPGCPAHVAHVRMDRDMVIEQYQDWLWNRAEDESPAARRELQRLVDLARRGPVTLVCWCYPRRCHAEEIRAMIEERLRRENDGTT